MPAKVKEMKDDMMVDVKCNKTFYLMCKNLSYHIFTLIPEEDRPKAIETIKDLEYPAMTDFQKSFYTMALMISEMEKQAEAGNFIVEKEILMPGDEGYEGPSAEELKKSIEGLNED
tara:strand:- start:1645 stop:1992 length:348 start_codon:yes stop_codon:yes gene_type:complete